MLLEPIELATEWGNLVQLFVAQQVTPDAMSQRTTALTPACQGMRPEDRTTYWETVVNIILRDHPGTPPQHVASAAKNPRDLAHWTHHFGQLVHHAPKRRAHAATPLLLALMPLHLSLSPFEKRIYDTTMRSLKATPAGS